MILQDPSLFCTGPKIFSQYSTHKYSEMLFVSICQCPSFKKLSLLVAY